MRVVVDSLVRYPKWPLINILPCQVASLQLSRRHITTIHSNLSDVSIDDFRSQGFTPQTPILIRSPERIDSVKIAAGAGIPAIDRWFKGSSARSDDDVFFQEDYLQQFESIVLPYELVTPVFDFQNGQDILRNFVTGTGVSLSKYLPRSNTTLNELLQECAIAEKEGEAESNTLNPNEANGIPDMLAVKCGKALIESQVELLRRHAALFQRFHSFRASLELIIKASRKSQGTSSFELPGLYIAQAQIADLPQQLRDDLPTPDIVSKAGKGDIYDANIWIGTPPTFTPLHKDPNPNLFVQMSSSKKVRLFEPRKGQALFATVRRKIGASPWATFRGEEMMQGHERVELKKAVWGPENEDEHEVIIQPGDALFIPKGWWHTIQSDGNRLNASVNWWFR